MGQRLRQQDQIVVRLILWSTMVVLSPTTAAPGPTTVTPASPKVASPPCVFDWLVSAGVPRTQAKVYAVKLGQNRVNISALASMNTFVLRLMGIKSADHQRKILHCATTNCNRPCQNGGRCLNRNADGSYHCQCAAGYVGERCKTDLCQPNPCLNGAPCSHNASAPGFRCSCRPGFEGTKCETMIDLCKLKKPCKNGGQCTPLVNDFKCECLPTFHGKACDVTWIDRHDYQLLKKKIVDSEGKLSSANQVLKQKLADSERRLSSAIQQLRTDTDASKRQLTSAVSSLDHKVGFLLSEWSTCYVAGVKFYYKLFLEARTFSSAKQRCESFGAHLVSITNAGEQTFLDRLVGRAAVHLWIGAWDEHHEGNWRWLDGSAWSYTNWIHGEPNGGRRENYVEWKRGSGWNDVNSDPKQGFLCKRRL